MMTVTISNIQQAAKGGFARVDVAGEWSTGGKGLKGRVVAWITSIVSRGKVTKENRTAIDQFVQAIGSDTRYGDFFSMVAKQRLKPLSDAGRPLRERAVTRVLSEIEDIRVSNDKLNLITAETLTDPKTRSQCLPGESFSDMLHEAARMRDLPLVDIEPYDACVEKAKANIRRDIVAAGDNGKKAVLGRESGMIVGERVVELVDQLVTLRDILKTSDMGEEEKHSLRQKLAPESDLNKEIIFSFIHGGRANQLANESGELPKMLSRAAETEGMGELARDFTLQVGSESTMAFRVAERLIADFPYAIATKEEILSVFRDEVSRYIADKKKLMDHVDTHDLMGAARVEMRKMIAQNSSIKKTEQIDVIIAAAPGYGTFCQSISVGGTEEMAAAYVRHHDSFDQAMKPLMHQGMTVDEVAPHRTRALSLWAAQQKDKEQSDPSQVADIRRDMKFAYDNLTGPAGDRWVNSTAWVAEQHRRVDSKVDDIVRIVQNMRHMMADEIGDYLGIEHADTRDGIVGKISGEADVSDNVYCMFRDLGVKVPLPELMGRSKAEAFDNRFSEYFLGEINEQLKTTSVLQNGIDRTTYVDMDRANYFTGEPGTPENLLTSARRGEGTEAALGIFNGVFDVDHDEAGKQAVSKVTNQSLFAAIYTAVERGYGPLSQSMATGMSDIDYRIWRESESDGSGYRVQASFAAPVQSIFNPADGSMRPTDIETSKFTFDASFRISRQSIDEGNPSAELLTAPTYEYRFDPAQEEA